MADPEMAARIHANRRIIALEATLTEQEWNSQAEIDSLTRALAFRDAALRESQAALTVEREGQAAAEREVAELRVSECWHRDRCTDLEREVAPIAAEASEYLPVYDGKPDSHIASVRLGLIRAVAALAADGTGRAGGEDGGRGAGGSEA